MVKEEILDLLDRHTTQIPVEREFVYRTIDFINENEDFLTRDNKKGHLTASAWILDHDLSHVLLIHHSKLDKWFQPGGHIEPDDLTIQNASLREAIEETGITRFKSISDSIFDIDIHEIPENKGIPAHNHYDIRFAFQSDSHLFNANSKEVKDIRWVKINEALENTELYGSVARMLKKSVLLGR